jgi:hypothetical protein
MALTLIRWLPAAFVAVLMVLFAYVAFAATGFMRGAGIFPYYIALAGLVLGAIELAGRVIHMARPDESRLAILFDIGLTDEDRTPAGYLRAILQLGWIVLYFGLMWLLGGLIGSVVFVVGFLRLGYRVAWPTTLAFGLGIFLFVWGLGRVLDLRWPRAVLQPWLPLP